MLKKSLDNNKVWKKIKIDGKEYRRKRILQILLLIHLGICKMLLSKNENYGFNIDDINYWMPVDQYISGVEHNT